MEIKDILGFILTVLFIVLFQVLGRVKKTRPHKEVPRPPVEKGPVVKPHKKVHVHQEPRRQASTPPAIVIKRKASQAPKKKSILGSKESLRKAFIFHEIIKRPYD